VTRRPAVIAALLGTAAVVLTGCGGGDEASDTTRPADDARSAEVRGVTARSGSADETPATTGVDVGDGTTPADEQQVLAELPAEGTARFTGPHGTFDLVVDRCAAARRDTLHLSGAAPDGSTLQVQVTGTTEDISWATSAGSWGGSVASLTVDPGSRQFQMTGRLRPLDDSAASSPGRSYTVVGRCPD
jgi:hypothetical protein